MTRAIFHLKETVFTMQKSTLLTAIAISLSLATPVFAEPQQQKPVSNTLYVLPKEIKEPYAAYVMGILPFNSYAAARYVGATRTSSEIPIHLEEAARNQLFTDLGLTAGGLALGAVLGSVFYSASRSKRYAENEAARFNSDAPDVAAQQAGMGLGLVLPLLAIPIAHVLWYGPFWEKAATDFNKKQLIEEPEN